MIIMLFSLLLLKKNCAPYSTRSICSDYSLFIRIYSSENFVLYEGNNTGMKKLQLTRHLLGTPNESK